MVYFNSDFHSQSKSENNAAVFEKITELVSESEVTFPTINKSKDQTFVTRTLTIFLIKWQNLFLKTQTRNQNPQRLQGMPV